MKFYNTVVRLISGEISRLFSFIQLIHDMATGINENTHHGVRCEEYTAAETCFFFFFLLRRRKKGTPAASRVARASDRSKYVYIAITTGIRREAIPSGPLKISKPRFQFRACASWKRKPSTNGVRCSSVMTITPLSIARAFTLMIIPRQSLLFPRFSRPALSRPVRHSRPRVCSSNVPNYLLLGYTRNERRNVTFRTNRRRRHTSKFSGMFYKLFPLFYSF